MDSSDIYEQEFEGETDATPSQLEEQHKVYATQFSQIHSESMRLHKSGKNNFWLSHRPLYAFKEGLQDFNLQSAAAGRLSGLTALFSGHIHSLQHVAIAEDRCDLLDMICGLPPQFVLGNGGVKLTHDIPTANAIAANILGHQVSDVYSHPGQFGYSVLTRSSSTPKSWGLHNFDLDNNLLSAITIEPRRSTSETETRFGVADVFHMFDVLGMSALVVIAMVLMCKSYSNGVEFEDT